MKKRQGRNEFREVILNYLGRHCCVCGSINSLEVDHIKPVSKGGQHVMENLQILCKKCHVSKTMID